LFTVSALSPELGIAFDEATNDFEGESEWRGARGLAVRTGLRRPDVHV